MNLDFHVHGLLSKKSRFDEDLFLIGIANAKEQGLDGYILCEHFNATYIDEIHEYLDSKYEYIGNKYIVEGFSVFIGMEIDIKNGGHIIVSAHRDDIAKLKKELECYKVKPNFIEFEKLLDLGEKYNCLMLGSHPYRDSHQLYLQPEELLKRLHGFDLNATDIHSRGLLLVQAEVRNLSNKLDVPYISGSDSHFPIQLGSIKTKFKKELFTVEEIKEEIQNRNYEVEISKALDLKVFAAKTTKSLIKEEISRKIG